MAPSFVLLATALSSALLAGILLPLGGVLRHPLAQRYGVAEAVWKRWALAFHALLVPMMLVNGLLIDKWGVEAVLPLGAMCAAVALSGLGLARSQRDAGLALTALAVGCSGLLVSGLVMLPRAFPSYRGVTALNLGLLFLGFGTLLALRLTGRLLERISPRRFLLILALLCLVPALFAVIPHPSTDAPDELPGEGLLGQPVFWLALIGLLFAGLMQGSLTSWVGHYLAEVGVSVSSGELILLFWWLLLLAGRLLAALAAISMRPGFEVWCLIGLTLLAAILIGNLIGTDYAVGGTVGALVLAVCLGPLVPTLLGVLAEQFPGQLGAALGAAFAVTSAGQVAFPPRFGPVTPQPAIRVWLRLPMILALLLGAALLTLSLVPWPV